MARILGRHPEKERPVTGDHRQTGNVSVCDVLTISIASLTIPASKTSV
jgi:hypothetical protein